MSNLQSKLDKNFKKKKNNFSFRKIDLRDADKFINKNFNKERNDKKFKKWIENMDGEYIVNNKDNNIIGRVFVTKKDKEITCFRVMDKYKGYGFGEILINDAIYKYHGKWLGVHDDNEIAIRLYKKAGFVEVRRITTENNGDVIIMELSKSILNKAEKNKVIIESVIKEKYLEGKLNDDKFNVLMNYYRENVIFNKPNYIINMDKWGPGHPLFITGSSGDGKSTLAKKLYKNEKNGALVTLDWLLIRLCYPRDKYYKKVVNNPYTQEHDFIIVRFLNEHPEMPWELGIGVSSDAHPNHKIVSYWYNVFFEWLLKEAKTTYSNYKIVVEGCDIAVYGNPRIFANEPLIVMGTSQLQGKINRIHRDHKDCGNPLIDSIKNELNRDHIKSLDNHKEKFKKMIKILQNRK